MSIEAAIAWEVCASIHQEYAKGKDGLFTTRLIEAKLKEKNT